VLTCRLYRDGKLDQEHVSPDRISSLLNEEGTLLWVDIEDPTENDLRRIEEHFSFHPLAMEDTQHRNQRPKVEVYEGYYFLVLYGLQLQEGDLAEHEIHVFVGEGYLVTLRYPPPYGLEKVHRRWERQANLASEGGGFLLYALLDEVVDDYFDAAERFEDESEEIEDHVFADDVDPDLQKRIFALKKRVVEFRRRVMPLREVLDLLQDEGGVVTDALRAYYRDVEDHVIRILEFVDSVRDLLTTALEAHLSQISNRLNQVMKQVSSWAAILLVPTVIAGFFGMNFANFGGWLSSWGWLWSGTLMFGASWSLYVYFRKQGWL
jgi:magnesium transporter